MQYFEFIVLLTTEGKTGKNFGGDKYSAEIYIRRIYIFGGDKYSAEINIRRR